MPQKISKEKLEKIKEKFEKALEELKNAEGLEKARVDFLGRKSELSLMLREVKNLSAEKKKELGQFANSVRQEIAEKIEDKKEQLEGKVGGLDEWLDVTAPGERNYIGSLNIITQTQREIEEIFSRMGFEIADGPDIEDEWHNFTALNMPADHPARDMQDTFWLKQEIKNGKAGEKGLVPRTQTSNVQIRYMENNQPPFKIVVPGRVYRNENVDAHHEHTFSQFETLVVGKKITVANFKHVAKTFFSEFFGQDLDIRLRPSYFPFTEPSFEFDISCTVCEGKGCRVCKQSGWLEIGGAGMVNQRVFEACGYKRNEWQGFAWGFGIERLAMMKYKVDEIRLFLSGELRFIKQF